MPELTDDEWQSVGEAFKAKVSVNSLSKTYGVSRAAINKQAERRGWMKSEAHDAIADAVESRARSQADGIDESQTEDEIRDAIHRAADSKAAIILQHREQWMTIGLLMQEANRAITDLTWFPEGFVYRDKTITEASEFTTFHRRVYYERLMNLFTKGTNALFMFQEGQRRAHGFDYKAQRDESASASATQDNRRELARRLDAIMQQRGVKVIDGSPA